MTQTQAFYALIIPTVPGARPEHPIVIPPDKPPAEVGKPEFPTPPIVIPPDEPGKPPLVIWGGGNMPFPEHPIVLPPVKPGDPPLVIWGPGDPRPSHPIYFPPEKPGDPPVIWGPPDPRPTPPIELPPGTPPERVKYLEPKAAWTPATGWIVVFVPTGDAPPMPAPSKK